jgi:glutathione S-transferase
MKLLYAPQSPFARKVRAAAIELGLGKRIDLEYTEAVPGQPNRAYGQSYNPLRKVPALVTDDGATIYDSTVICEYLDDLAGGGIIVPREASRRWRVLTNHALAQGLCELGDPHSIRNVAPAGSAAVVELD